MDFDADFDLACARNQLQSCSSAYPTMIITSLTNPRVKHVVALNDRKQREQDGLMLVEGYDPLGMALHSGVAPKTLFICPVMMKVSDGHYRALRAACLAAGAEVIEVSEPVFAKMAYRDGPDGWLGVFAKPRYDLASLPARWDGARAGKTAPLILVAEHVEKPGNLGAMLRTCDAAGVTAFISCDPLADLGNPNVVRASQGALFSVPIAEGTSQEVMGWLRARGIRMLATTPNPINGKEPAYYTDADLTQPVAIVVGEEKHGLSDFWLKQADAPIKIPMTGKINSLNVSISAALCVYEAVKQRAR